MPSPLYVKLTNAKNADSMISLLSDKPSTSEDDIHVTGPKNKYRNVKIESFYNIYSAATSYIHSL